VESSEANNRSELHGLTVAGTNPSPPARLTMEPFARPLPE
jgi:hypothetical protein